MSKLESLGKFLILTERCSPEVVERVIEALGCLCARWWDGDAIGSDDEGIIDSVLKQEVSLTVDISDSGSYLSYSQERFYRGNPEYCGGNFISAEYFLFLAEDHLYEKQSGGGAPK